VQPDPLTLEPDELETELRRLKERRVALLRRKIEAVQSFGLRYYRPHPKQVVFHQAGMDGKRRRLASCGNRFGKSTMGGAEDCSWALNYRPWIPESDPRCRAGLPQRPVRGLVITTDWETVDDVFTGNRGTKGKFWSLLPKDAIKSALRNHVGTIDTLEFVNGSLIKFNTVKAYMTNPQSIESKDWDFLHIDEPCPEGMFTAASRGLMDRQGSVWFTLTPLREPWITDYFTPKDNESYGTFFVMDGSPYDNPYLTKEAIAEFEATLTDEEKQCRIHGIPLHMAGLVYKEFSRERHIMKKVPKGWDSYLSPPRDYSYYVYIDPHPQTPHAVLFCAVSPLGQHFYYANLFERCGIEELCRKIHKILDGRIPVRVRLDPLGFINNPITETNMADEFARCGIIAEKATKALEHGIIKVKEQLLKEDLIYFSPECRRTIWEIERYCWDDKDNRPVDRDDHMMENLYRCELEDPIWVPAELGPNPMQELVIDRTELRLDDIELVEA